MIRVFSELYLFRTTYLDIFSLRLFFVTLFEVGFLSVAYHVVANLVRLILCPLLGPSI